MKWIYNCSYCGEKTLEAEKRDTMTCGYCEHPSSRMQSTSERIENEREVLELEQQARNAAIDARQKLGLFRRWFL